MEVLFLWAKKQIGSAPSKYTIHDILNTVKEMET